MNNDLTFLASAYLDGNITPTERAQVDGDSDLLAEVERLRQVRAVLGSTEPAPISVRERHLAAALDAWDRLPAAERSGELRDATPAGADSAAAAGAASVIAPIPLRDRRKNNGNGKLLAMAAGLILVLGGGLVVRGLVGGSSQDSDFSADAPTAEEADSKTAQGDLAQDAVNEQFDVEIAADDEAVSAADPDSAAATGGGSETFTGADEPPAPEDGLEVLESNVDLAVFAADVTRAAQFDTDDAAVSENAPIEADPAATEAPSAEPDEDGALDTVSTANTCGLVDLVVGPATYRVGLFDEIVWVGINNSQQAVIAYDIENCREVARTAVLAP